jgi:hypothetical protein
MVLLLLQRWPIASSRLRSGTEAVERSKIGTEAVERSKGGGTAGAQDLRDGGGVDGARAEADWEEKQERSLGEERPYYTGVDGVVTGGAVEQEGAKAVACPAVESSPQVSDCGAYCAGSQPLADATAAYLFTSNCNVVHREWR